MPDPTRPPCHRRRQQTAGLVAMALETDRAAIEAAAVATIIDAVLPPGSSIVWRLAARDGWVCFYCDRPLGWGNQCVLPPQVEHRVPRSRGGSDHPSNLCLSCVECNADKGTLTDVEYAAKVACASDAEGYSERPGQGPSCPWPRPTMADYLAQAVGGTPA